MGGWQSGRRAHLDPRSARRNNGHGAEGLEPTVCPEADITACPTASRMMSPEIRYVPSLIIPDEVGFVHAMLLRIQALLLPVKTLVLSGH